MSSRLALTLHLQDKEDLLRRSQRAFLLDGGGGRGFLAPCRSGQGAQLKGVVVRDEGLYRFQPEARDG